MDHISRVGIFLAVVEHESFTGAARSLGMTGPAVSKHIQSLESQLRVKLLNRTTRHVSLTEEGAIYYDRARKALEDLNEAEQQIQELKTCPTGKLKVNAPMSFGSQYLTKPIAQFAKKFPEVTLDVEFSDRWVDVVAEGFDVVVRIGSLDDSGLVARKLAPCPIILCASKRLIQKYGLPESADALRDYPAVVYSRHSQKEQWRYQNEEGDIGSVTLNRQFAANTAEMQLDACLEGVGISLLPIFAIHQYVASGELVRLLPAFNTIPERGIYAMFPKNRYLSTRSRLFIDWLSAQSSEFSWCQK